MKIFIKILLRMLAQLTVGLSVVWLINGGGPWFLIPWTIGWLLYNQTLNQ